MIFLAYLVLFLSFINLIRMAVFLVASDVYDIKYRNPNKTKDLYFSPDYNPLVTIIVPAHNEEETILNNLSSIANSNYRNFEIIVACDSCTDRTLAIARNFQRRYRHALKRIMVLDINVRGKAKALNCGLKYAKGSLFMCLDADSFLTPNALGFAVQSFREKSLGSLSSNVKIAPAPGLLNILQRVEYLVCYQMKKAETVTGVQYIVGGIGSMYRTKLIREMGLYETNTITEDIDLSMKLIERYGNKKYIGYNPNVVVYTGAVTNLPDLLKQRFRWKYGRYQVFLKRKSLFLSRKRIHNPFLSWLYLPYALFAEISYTLEPITIGLIIFLIGKYGDFTMIIGSTVTFCFYTIIQISGALQGYSKEERFELEVFAPLAYIFMYLLSFVEYVATIRGLLNLRKLFLQNKAGDSNCDWVHVERAKIN